MGASVSSTQPAAGLPWQVLILTSCWSAAMTRWRADRKHFSATEGLAPNLTPRRAIPSKTHPSCSLCKAGALTNLR